ncbi:response regulator transcription factor [Actinokineospora cianjurensis]|uniref:DNA-binding response OmpR family regulator n=1 Tax=Actinokineospora cianjurensis TaxID=585224 RepID=A0A421AWL1_9PSEU|nr:response regulator transcription factor [Actinokineospora cianjurensis]RLK54260.1 DNA-binding response OmpR family regulator [Actinokineospora cianjurensis]
MARILVVDDDPGVPAVLRLLFDAAGHELLCAGDGRTGLRLLHQTRPHLLLLDLGLVAVPGMDGWDVLERVRDIADLPVLLLSAHGGVADKVRGLRGGADDVLTKPFAAIELLARVEALLRRAGGAPGERAQVYDDGEVRVDPRTRLVSVHGRELELTGTEFRLLNVLVRNPGAALTLADLLASVWDDPSGIAPDRVKFAVLRLRRKLGWAGNGSPLSAVRGVGYRYRPRGVNRARPVTSR